MNRPAVIGICASVVLVVGYVVWNAVSEQMEIQKAEECQRLDYVWDCGETWINYRMNPTSQNIPLCDTGELSIREVGELANREMELGCPARQSKIEFRKEK